VRDIFAPVVVVVVFALWAGYVSTLQGQSIDRAHAALRSR
jgi:hypothetical protein